MTTPIIYTTSNPNTDIYLGDRGENFKKLISGLLTKSKLKPKYINFLLNDENMKLYSNAFSSSTSSLCITNANTPYIDKKANNNYEVFEIIGDSYFHSFISSYTLRRFPFLNCSAGVKIIARIKINFGSTKTFSDIGDKLGFWPYISAAQDVRDNRKKALLEDVFEAFLGTTAFLLDENFRRGVGYAIVYDILATIFDEIDIPTNFYDLNDSVTNLKEIFDRKQELGAILYTFDKDELTKINKCNVYRVIDGNGPQKVIGGQKILMSTGQAAKKENSKELAAYNALQILHKNNIINIDEIRNNNKF